MATLPHTYSNTKQVRLLRNMIVREDGDDLLIGFAMPRPWLAPGKLLGVRRAPTRFGPVTLRMAPADDGSTIRVFFEPPPLGVKGTARIRLREPQQREIKSVEIKPEMKMSFRKDVIELAQPTRPLALTVRY